jgi:hypothetical protein
MCEFKVYMEESEKRTEIAKNVIKARLKDGKVVLMGSAGDITKVDGARILVVDTLMQELVLEKD